MAICGDERTNWLDSENIRPYIFIRKDNKIKDAGSDSSIDWFPHEPLYFDPLKMKQASFANQILNLEHRSFERSDMPIPRWVFFDCAVMPGFVAGMAHRVKTLPDHLREVLLVEEGEEWVPLSLFILIPTLIKEEWVAYSLCSANSLLADKTKRFYGLGFLTKAFAFWFANIKTCFGMTQWGSVAMKLHAQYGDFRVVTAYTPIHNFAATLTYCLNVEPDYWSYFFSGFDNHPQLQKSYKIADFEVDSFDKHSLISFQKKIEGGSGPYFLKSNDVRYQKDSEILKVYQEF